MKNLIIKPAIGLFFMLMALSMPLCAQTESFDLFTYKIPQGWIKDVKQTYISYTLVDKTKGQWCQLAIYRHIPSKGNIDADFAGEWNKLAVMPNNIKEKPNLSKPENANGWTIVSGAAKYRFEGSDAVALLTTFSGYNTCASILAKTNSKDLMDNVYAFINSVDLQKPAGVQTIPPPSTNNTPTTSNDKSGFKFNTTNWDDGWVSTVQPDWVDVSKGNIKILLHYNQSINAINTDVDKTCSAAWNVYIAPRYSNMRDYKIAPNTLSSTRAYMAQATLTAANGSNHFVVLFSKGKTGWMEVICPDKSTFVQTFGIDIDRVNFNTEDKLWEPLQKMSTYNKFAIAPSDFSGKWTNNFGGNTYYTNMFTGLSAGMSTYSSNQEYQFSGGSYKWYIVAVNSYGGTGNYAQGKGEGSFNVPDNWHIYFTNIEGKPRTYNAQFCSIKGGRLLVMDGVVFGKVE